MFNFNFLLQESPLSGIISNMLPVLGTALATLIAATYTGYNANKIAKKNNENIWKLENKNREIDTINSLYVAYNNFNHYVDSFFDSQKDNERVNILDLSYNSDDKDFAYYKKEQFIQEFNIAIVDSMKLGNLISEQTADYSSLLINLKNNLLLSRKYFDDITYKKLNKKVDSYKQSFDYILNSAIELKNGTSPAHQMISSELVHLHNRTVRIKSLYAMKGKFELDKDDDQIFSTPIILSYQRMFHAHLEIIEIFDNHIKDN